MAKRKLLGRVWYRRCVLPFAGEMRFLRYGDVSLGLGMAFGVRSLEDGSCFSVVGGVVCATWVVLALGCYPVGNGDDAPAPDVRLAEVAAGDAADSALYGLCSPALLRCAGLTCAGSAALDVVAC